MEGRRSRALGSGVPSVPDPGQHEQDGSESDEIEMTLDAISPRRMIEYLGNRGYLTEPTVAGTPLFPVANEPLSSVMPPLFLLI